MLRSQQDKVFGKCTECGRPEKDLSPEIKVLKDTCNLFNQGVQNLELGQFDESATILKECLTKRKQLLDKNSKDVAETQDALARYNKYLNIIVPNSVISPQHGYCQQF